MRNKLLSAAVGSALVLALALSAVPVASQTNCLMYFSVLSGGYPVSGASVGVYTDSSLDTFLGGGVTPSNGQTSVFFEGACHPSYFVYVQGPSGYGSTGEYFTPVNDGTTTIYLSQITTTQTTTSSQQTTTSSGQTTTTSSQQTTTSSSSTYVTTSYSTYTVNGTISTQTVVTVVTVVSYTASQGPGGTPTGNPILPQPAASITEGLLVIGALLVLAFSYRKDKDLIRKAEKRLE